MGHLRNSSPGVIHLSNVSPGGPNCRLVLATSSVVALEERLVIGGVLGSRGDVGTRGCVSGTRSIGTTVVSRLGISPVVELAVIISPSKLFACKASLHRRIVGASMASSKVIVTGRNAVLTSRLQLWRDSGSGMVNAGVRGIPYSDALDHTLRIRRQHVNR